MRQVKIGKENNYSYINEIHAQQPRLSGYRLGEHNLCLSLSIPTQKCLGNISKIIQ